MYFRPAFLALFAALLLAGVTGCQKPESSARALPPTMLPPDTIASVHWLGKRRLGYEATAFFFMRIWNQTPSARLERQTINRLATAPGQWLPGGTNLTADACARLAWLINELVQEEAYLEVCQPSNGGDEIVFAIRLNAAQSDQWRTNLPIVLEPLTGTYAAVNPDQSWSLPTTNALNLIQLTRVGDWTLVGLSTDKNSLLADLAARIRRDGVPFVSAGTNLWLEADFNPSYLATVDPLRSSLVTRHASLAHVHLTLSGDGANVITRTKLEFASPLPDSSQPWQLPLPLLHEPLTSLTVVRGLQPWLAGWPAWSGLLIGAPPNQFCLWSLASGPYQVYLATPLSAAGVSGLTGQLLARGNPWLAAHGYISFDPAPDGNGVTWGQLPDIKPFIKFAGDAAQGWLYAGLFPDTNTAALPPPAGLIQDILRRTNLVYYDWEVTGPRLQPCFELGQTARLIARRPQLPLNSASLNWLGAIIPRLGTTATIINRAGPAELTFYRRSTLGLTAPELQLLADWLESSQFPRSLHAW